MELFAFLKHRMVAQSEAPGRAAGRDAAGADHLRPASLSGIAAERPVADHGFRDEWSRADAGFSGAGMTGGPRCGWSAMPPWPGRFACRKAWHGPSSSMRAARDCFMAAADSLARHVACRPPRQGPRRGTRRCQRRPGMPRSRSRRPGLYQPALTLEKSGSRRVGITADRRCRWRRRVWSARRRSALPSAGPMPLARLP